MNTLHPLLRAAIWCALSGGASLAHATDQPGALPDAADPGQVVPATRYQSAMQYRAAAPAPESPEKQWKALNEQVGAQDSMALTAQDTDAPAATMHTEHAGHAAPATPADPHAGHKMKEGK